jgi:hypothetical protein
MPAAQRRILSPAPALLLAVLVSAMAPGAALAQQGAAPAAPAQPAAPSREIPPPDQLEPGVNTTPTTAAPAPALPDTPAADGAARTSQAAAAPKAAAAASKSSARKGPDRLQLDTTEITGNRELPKVLYIVPWKRSDLGDLAGRPVNSLLDEVLQPLDRDVFRRENRYYDALKSEATAPKAGPLQGSESRP